MHPEPRKRTREELSSASTGGERTPPPKQRAPEIAFNPPASIFLTNKYTVAMGQHFTTFALYYYFYFRRHGGYHRRQLHAPQLAFVHTLCHLKYC